ncbi:MAG TPA: OAM dimerization domain-containing protein, partial [Solirubrobacteraceae bacterium]|nr:OAM dimerization domain-containing protein [Solirubrobacteraceae bacterium]
MSDTGTASGSRATNGAATAAGGRPQVDLAQVKPYADHLGDGIVQFSFTLPVPYGLAARKAAQEWAAKMGFEHPEVVHYQELTDGYTYFVMFGESNETVDYASLSQEGFEIEYMS